MGVRFHGRVRIAPGLTVSPDPSGTVGVPATGISYTTKDRRRSLVLEAAPQPAYGPDPVDRLRIGPLRRMFMDPKEAAFVDALRAYGSGEDEEALQTLASCDGLADADYLAGMILLKEGRLSEAAGRLERARLGYELGELCRKWKVVPVVNLEITPEIVVQVHPDTRGILLLLVELYQELERFEEAQRCVAELINVSAGDSLARLSAAELLLDMAERDEGVRRQALELALRLTDPGENIDEFDTALMLYRARALRRLGMLDGAKETLNAALRRKKGRSQNLLLELRYERALVYKAMGKEKQARKELEVIYGEDPSFRDVAARLGLGT